jgi:hypothetical protein
MKERMYSTPEVEGVERQCVLFVVATANGQAAYRGSRWGRSDRHWLIELQDGNQVEIHNDPPLLIHIPKPGYTFELDGTCREVRAIEKAVVLQ